MIKSGNENNCGTRVIPGPMTNSLFSLNTSIMRRIRVWKFTGVDSLADDVFSFVLLFAKTVTKMNFDRYMSYQFQKDTYE
jgi:hypothetical protein